MQVRLRPLPDLGTLGSLRRFRVADVLELASYTGASVLAGEGGLDRLVTHVNAMQIPTGHFALAGDLVLAADETFGRSATHPGELLAALDDRRVAAVAARSCGLVGARDALAKVAAARQLPFIELPDDAHLSELLGSTLEALVATQATELRRAAAVREQMGAFALAGGELNDLPDAVAELAAGDVAIVADDRVVMATSTAWGEDSEAAALASAWLERDNHDPALADGGVVLWPLVAGAVRVGCLVARLGGPLEPVRLAALEYGSNIAALEILHRREATAADDHLRRRFVADLLSGVLESDAAARRAAALGWTPQDHFLVALAHGHSTTAANLVEVALAAAPATVAVEHRGACLLVVASDDSVERASDALIATLETAAEDVHVGTSAESESISELPRAVREAEEALRAAELFDARTRVRHQSELGALRMLADVPRWELQAFAAEVLAPLDAIEPAGDGPLGTTLRTLLETGLNMAETARRGGWHYNTVRYRAQRLTELLGPYLEDGTRLQALSIAQLLRRELGRHNNGARSVAVSGLELPVPFGDHPPEEEPHAQPAAHVG